MTPWGSEGTDSSTQIPQEKKEKKEKKKKKKKKKKMWWLCDDEWEHSVFGLDLGE